MRRSIDSDGSIALPKELCAELGLHPGDEVELEIVDGGIVVRPVVAEVLLPEDHVELPPLATADVEVMRRSANR